METTLYSLKKAKNGAPLIYLEKPTKKTSSKSSSSNSTTTSVKKTIPDNNSNVTIPLASRFDPFKEAERILQNFSETLKNSQNTNPASLVVVLGVGNPLLIVAAKKQFKHAQFLLICKHEELANLVKPSLQNANEWLRQRWQSSDTLSNKNFNNTTIHNNNNLETNTITCLCENGQTNFQQTDYNTTNETPKKEHTNTHNPPQPFMLGEKLETSIRAYFKKSSQLGKNIAFLKNQREVQQEKMFFHTVQEKIVTIQNEKAINRNTFHRFEKIWLTNLTRNARCIAYSKGLQKLSGIAKNSHAILLGAGPSLELDMDSIKELRSSAFLISLDTTVKPLLSRGIVPDAIASVDPQKINAKYLENLPKKVYENCMFFAEPAVCPSSLRLFKKVIVFNNFFPFYKLMMGFFGSKGDINAGGSVASAGYELARVMQFASITLCGIDLSFLKNAYHVRGSMYEEQWLQNCSRTTPFETKIQQLFETEVLKSHKNVAGKTVYVDSPMSMYKDWFQKTEVSPFLARYNASKTGVVIKGFTNITLENWKNLVMQLSKEQLPEANDLSKTKSHLLKNIAICFNSETNATNLPSSENPSFSKNSLVKREIEENTLLEKTLEYNIHIAYSNFLKSLGILLQHLKILERKLQKALVNSRKNRIESLQNALAFLSSNILLRDLVSATMQKTIDDVKDSHANNETEATNMLRQLGKDALASCRYNIDSLKRVPELNDITT